MPAKLPSLKATKVIRVLEKRGFVKERQKGSHVILRNQDGDRVVIPVHKGKDMKKPLLKKIIEQEARLTIEEFLKLL